MLDYGDYFTILLTGISGIFVKNRPLSSQIIFLTVGEEGSARFLDYFAIFLTRISGIFVNNPPPKTLHPSLGARCRGAFVVVVFASARLVIRRRPMQQAHPLFAARQVRWRGSLAESCAGFPGRPAHGTRFEMMAILVKALKCVTKRLRAFP